MAAPAFASYTVTVDNSLTLNTPSGAAAGDLLVVVFKSDGNSDWSAGSNGFITPANNRLYSSIDCTIEWFYLPLNSAPASSYTFTRTGGGACRGWMIRVTGANLSAPFDVYGFQEDTSSNTSHNLPTLTTTVADALLLAFSLVSSGASYTPGEFTPPSGYTKISETGTIWCHVSAAWKAQATAGSTGAASFTGVSAQSLQLLIAVKPAASAHNLGTQNGSLSLAAPASDLSQSHALSAQPGVTTFSAPAFALSQNHTLAAETTALALVSTDIALSQGEQIVLSLQSGVLTPAAPGAALGQGHSLSSSAAILPLAGTVLVLSQSHTLAAVPGGLSISGSNISISGGVGLEGFVFHGVVGLPRYGATVEKGRYSVALERPRY